MQYAERVAELAEERDPAKLLAILLAAHGDKVTLDEQDGSARIEQVRWRLFSGLEGECRPEWFEGWRGLYEGVLAVMDRGVRLDVTDRLDFGGECFVWEVKRYGPPRGF